MSPICHASGQPYARLSLSVQRPIYMTRPTGEFGTALEGDVPEASPIAEAGPIARLARN